MLKNEKLGDKKAKNDEKEAKVNDQNVDNSKVDDVDVKADAKTCSHCKKKQCLNGTPWISTKEDMMGVKIKAISSLSPLNHRWSAPVGSIGMVVFYNPYRKRTWNPRLSGYEFEDFVEVSVLWEELGEISYGYTWDTTTDHSREPDSFAFIYACHGNLVIEP